MNTKLEEIDLICFSHLRWNFVYQRPQHLMSRFAKKMRLFFIEEPVYDSFTNFEISNPVENLWLVTPRLPKGISETAALQLQKEFISRLIINMNIDRYVAWYYTPMALRISDHLNPALIVYDCMDELTAFKFAHQTLKNLENELFNKADIVFTGGYSLYEAKKNQHENIHPFPSSIDYGHFVKARSISEEPADQAHIPRMRFGFYGVIDERMDLKLLEEVAMQRRDWHFILIGPVIKISERDLPRLSNIHYLGMKTYEELPTYLAGWDVAIMPFARNESTRFISPTKTPEYLAGGKPVISAPINDVIRHYGKVVHIAGTADEFIRVAEHEIVRDSIWLSQVDEILKGNSWDQTWLNMIHLIEQTLSVSENKLNKEKKQQYV
jgi:UDP-galactopyranose mutase